ncbi:MAG: hypothetical protein HQL45_16695 [Alphaproteobacteria bacterium]|nr:hypothetical protein [Alphaproteobacteria bacterium]
MFKPLRVCAALLSVVLVGATVPAQAVGPGIAPVLFIGVFTGAGPVLTLGQEALSSVGFGNSEERAKAEEAAKTADWATAKRVSVKLEDDMISPAWLRLKSGTPYILELENTDGDSGSIRAADFFANASTDASPILGMVRTGAEEKREIRVIAFEKGVYDMDMGLFSTAWGILGKIEVY